MRTVTIALATVMLSSGAAFAQQAEPLPDFDPAPAAEAAPAPATAPQVADPYEGFNRRMFKVHKGVDRTVVRPLAKGYKAVTNPPVRRGVGNVLRNLGEPVTLVNDVLQGQVTRAGETAFRFLANSTVGVLGVFDVATPLGFPAHREDFGQTMAVYGAQPGPYLFIPVLGPTTVRDAGGRIVDAITNPLNTELGEGARTGAAAVRGVDARSGADGQIQQLETTATDEYATYRSLYLQNRAAEIANGQTDLQALPEFDEVGPPQPAPQSEPTPPNPRRR
jgi:phospholipid-binding lipoprotein MlaA